MVVQDANGEAHVGNISLLPSEKKWMFNEINNDFDYLVPCTVKKLSNATVLFLLTKIVPSMSQ